MFFIGEYFILHGQENAGAINQIYYGQLVTDPSQLSTISWPILGIFAGEDAGIPVEKVSQFESALDSLQIPNKIIIYPGVGHAFANPSGMSYAPEESKDAWGKTIEFLKNHLNEN